MQLKEVFRASIRQTLTLDNELTFISYNCGKCEYFRHWGESNKKDGFYGRCRLLNIRVKNTKSAENCHYQKR